MLHDGEGHVTTLPLILIPVSIRRRKLSIQGEVHKTLVTLFDSLTLQTGIPINLRDKMKIISFNILLFKINYPMRYYTLTSHISWFILIFTLFS